MKRKARFNIPVKFPSLRRSRGFKPQRAASRADVRKAIAGWKDIPMGEVGRFEEQADGSMRYYPSAAALRVLEITAKELNVTIEEIIQTAIVEGLRNLLRRN
jgi:hypothetical protein